MPIKDLNFALSDLLQLLQKILAFSKTEWNPTGELFWHNEVKAYPLLIIAQEYEVDYIDYKILGKCDTRMTFYTSNTADGSFETLYETRHMSTSKYKDDMSQWDNHFVLNFMTNENSDNYFVWPLSPNLPTPKPDGIEIEELRGFTISNRFNINKGESPENYLFIAPNIKISEGRDEIFNCKKIDNDIFKISNNPPKVGTNWNEGIGEHEDPYALFAINVFWKEEVEKYGSINWDKELILKSQIHFNLISIVNWKSLIEKASSIRIDWMIQSNSNENVWWNKIFNISLADFEKTDTIEIDVFDLDDFEHSTINAYYEEPIPYTDGNRIGSKALINNAPFFEQRYLTTVDPATEKTDTYYEYNGLKYKWVFTINKETMVMDIKCGGFCYLSQRRDYLYPGGNTQYFQGANYWVRSMMNGYKPSQVTCLFGKSKINSIFLIKD